MQNKIIKDENTNRLIAELLLNECWRNEQYNKTCEELQGREVILKDNPP